MIEKKSYGVICCRYNKKKDELEVLLVQKRYTYYYIEFILGHYKKNDDKKLRYLFNNMTINEKVDILSMDFGQMWYRFCLTNPDRSNINMSNFDYNRYKICKNKFETTFKYDKTNRLRNLINLSLNKGVIWEIPKGRKSYPQEKELNCAIREFYEETNIDEQLYELVLSESPKILSYISSNVKYTNLYYIAIANKKRIDNLVSKSIYNDDEYVKINFETNEQVSEILSVKWATENELKIMDISGRFYNLMKPIFKNLLKKHKLPQITKLNIL